MEYFALEGVFEYKNEFKADSSFSVESPSRGTLTATASSEISTIGFWTNAKGILPLGTFEPYLTGGVGLLYADELALAEVTEQSADDSVQINVSNFDAPVVFAGRVAAGIDHAITDKAGLFAEAAYALPTSDLSDFNYISVNFGGRLTS